MGIQPCIASVPAVDLSVQGGPDRLIRIDSHIRQTLSVIPATIVVLVLLLPVSGLAQNADFDNSGSVGFEDFLLFTAAFGKPDTRFDLDTSGIVDFGDFLIFVSQFGKPGPPTNGLPPDRWIPVPLTTKAQRAAGIAGGEGMQLVYGLSYAPSNPDVVYLVSDVSQVWKSIDGGATWAMKHSGFLANGGLSLVVDPNDEKTVFVAGSTQEDVSDDFADGIYRTGDGGESWSLVHRTPFGHIGEKKGGVNFAFAGADTIYAATHTEGLLRSIDGGTVWTGLGHPSESAGKLLDVRTHPKDHSTLYIATEGGLFTYSEADSGSFRQIGSGIGGFPHAIAIRPVRAVHLGNVRLGAEG